MLTTLSYWGRQAAGYLVIAGLVLVICYGFINWVWGVSQAY